MDETNRADQGDLKNLRTKTSGADSTLRFNKKIFGGINEEEVQNHIASLNKQFVRTEDAYKDRIDEFTTFSQMLTKERDEALELIQIKTKEINDIKAEMATLKTKNSALVNALEESETKIAEYVIKESLHDEAIESDMSLKKENELLKEELLNANEARELDASDNAVLKRQLEISENSLFATRKERDEIKETSSVTHSMIRQNEMRKSLKLSEFASKNFYSLNLAEQNLREMITTMEDMKNDVSKLFNELKENKFTDTIQNSSLNNSQEEESNI